MKAILTNYNQSPRKVRLVADLIRGKKVNEAFLELSYLDKRAAGPIKKLLTSATANAKENFQKEQDKLFVKEITVDKGMVLKRSRPAARGSAHRILRRRSVIKITLDDGWDKIEKGKKIVKVEPTKITHGSDEAKNIEKKQVKKPAKVKNKQ